MLGGCWFQTKFGEFRDGEVTCGSGKMDVRSFLVITLDIVDVGFRRGLGMLEFKRCVAGVRERLRSWKRFCDFRELLRSLYSISTIFLL